MKENNSLFPVHTIGIVTIIGYGFLFYTIAPLKEYISLHTNLSEELILTLFSLALLFQALLAPRIGKWSDHHGSLIVIKYGLLLGMIGSIFIGITEIDLFIFKNVLWVFISMFLITLGLGMSTYEVAFNAAVQMDEINSRKNISIITFYGAVASTITWLSIYPLIYNVGLFYTCLFISIILLIGYVLVSSKEMKYKSNIEYLNESKLLFNWNELNKTQKKSFFYITISSSLQNFFFVAFTLALVNFFTETFNDISIAVLLASIYGPFQLVGRYLEMKIGKHYDARYTGLIAFLFVIFSIFTAQFTNNISVAAISMAFFGMGHGVLTITYGYVTNMYFESQIYGQAKGWMALSRSISFAVGPAVGAFLFAYNLNLFTITIVITAILSAFSFLLIIFEKPTNQMHEL